MTSFEFLDHTEVLTDQAVTNCTDFVYYMQHQGYTCIFVIVFVPWYMGLQKNCRIQFRAWDKARRALLNGSTPKLSVSCVYIIDNRGNSLFCAGCVSVAYMVNT